MTGADPVPVPPPRPQVMKTSCASPIMCLISSLLSWVASSPSLGSLPAPRPRVAFLPSRSLRCDLILVRCCASVFMATSVAPSMFISDILAIVLEPLPPAPTTYIFGLASSMNLSSSSSSGEENSF